MLGVSEFRRLLRISPGFIRCFSGFVTLASEGYESQRLDVDSVAFLSRLAVMRPGLVSGFAWADTSGQVRVFLDLENWHLGQGDFDVWRAPFMATHFLLWE